MFVMMLCQVNHEGICFRVDGACLLAPRGWSQAMLLYFLGLLFFFLVHDILELYLFVYFCLILL